MYRIDMRIKCLLSFFKMFDILLCMKKYRSTTTFNMKPSIISNVLAEKI